MVIDIDQKKLRLLSTLFVMMYLIGGGVAVILSLLFNYNREHIGIAFLAGCLLSFTGISSWKLKEEDGIKGVSRFFRITFLLWLVSIIISIVIYINSEINYSIPIEFFLMIGLGTIVLGVQILLPIKISKGYTLLILSEIFITSIIVSTAFL